MDVIQVDKISSTVAAIAAIAGSVTIIMTAIATTSETFRKTVASVFGRIFRRKWNDKKQLIDDIASLSSKIDSLDTKIDDVASKMDIVGRKNDENEKDRLKSVIFGYGNMARRKQHISSEEFRYLQTQFEKYTKLGGNDIAHEEYEFVVDYYNAQKTFE